MAAAYAHGIIKNHPFIDGNKRTGILTAISFLEYNMGEIDLSQTDFFNLAIDIATSKLSIPEVAIIFKSFYSLN